jgi:CheY-like chemotaxis protein
MILDGAGYRVETAADGEDALLMLEDTKPDLVLLDLMMTEVDDFDVIRGVQGYVRKSFDAVAVVGTLDEVLRHGIGCTER